eukprot:4227877-Pleurochrysis_carterae.AAC.1
MQTRSTPPRHFKGAQGVLYLPRVRACQHIFNTANCKLDRLVAGDPVVKEEPRGKQAAAAEPQRASQTAAAPQPQREAPAAAPQPPAKKPAAPVHLFGGAPAPVPAAKPKTRAELMQAMCSLPPAPAQPPAPAPALAPAPPTAPPPAPPVAQMQPASPAPAASPARAAAEKKMRAPHGAPDATNPPEATKRKRKTQVADTDKEEVEDKGKKYKNQSKIGMNYETTKKLGEKLR